MNVHARLTQPSSRSHAVAGEMRSTGATDREAADPRTSSFEEPTYDLLEESAVLLIIVAAMALLTLGGLFVLVVF